MRWLRRMGSKMPKKSFCCIVLFITVCAASSNSGGASAAAFRGRFLGDDDNDVIVVSDANDAITLENQANAGLDGDNDGDDEDAQEAAYEIDWMAVFMNLGGGIAFFLFVNFPHQF